MREQLSEFLYKDEAKAVDCLLASFSWKEGQAASVTREAAGLVEALRAAPAAPGQLEDFLRHYALNTPEGLALMELAEALLRVPDRATADRLIADKMSAADWNIPEGEEGKDWVLAIAGVGLLMTHRTLASPLSSMGAPVIRTAVKRAIRMLGQQFVLGTDIDDALRNSEKLSARGYHMSYDMLGEGARTARGAARYAGNYRRALKALGDAVGYGFSTGPSGISVKLSALHPRYESAQADICVPAIAERLKEFAYLAAEHNLRLTIDAEESERLELSLDILDEVLSDLRLKDWDGLGLAVQAYQKRALPLIDHLAERAQHYKHRLQIRLVKGAYWDSEIKRAQILGLSDYPVFTRKSHTDLSYLACAAKLFAHNDHLYPMFATHNAHSIAAVMSMGEEAGTGYEFQRLYGMGGGLYDLLMAREGAPPVSVYAPVGPHEDLLAYLVRRLLENGANSAFVHRVMDPAAPVDSLVEDPVGKIRKHLKKRHPSIPLPSDLYRNEPPAGRTNSTGVDLDDPVALKQLQFDMKGARTVYRSAPVIDGKLYKDGVSDHVVDPSKHRHYPGEVFFASKNLIEPAMKSAAKGFSKWRAMPADERAAILERYGDLLEKHRAELMALCVQEAGKTLADARDEVREAIDFCRYYAAQGRVLFGEQGTQMSGPTGEDNRLYLQGRGVFVCISPWNFPLAIFTGQIAAALMAGNAVMAKPAEQTPLIAARALELLQEAGLPRGVLNFLPGDGRIGAALVAHENVAGVAFTGSTEVAREINRTLAAKDGPIVPLIAETGGQNAMIVDSTALLEQVVDDVILSAFGSAGQRCSALRVLYVQDNIAENLLRMLGGAMDELRVGDPGKYESDIGPLIDEEALAALTRHRVHLEGCGHLIGEASLPDKLKNKGHFFAPCAFEIPDLSVLKGEVFGPILHVIRYKERELDEVIEEINAQGYGLTFGVHSRIKSRQDELAQRVDAGNIYISRGTTGAVVGVQPFGGQGLSGTGPKAGGPHYLPRFATEKHVSINTAAAGGNASLVTLGE